jgi:type III pantothenate kinase
MQHSPRQLVLTGGDAELFAQHLQQYQPIVEADLLLKGLQHYMHHQAKSIKA